MGTALDIVSVDEAREYLNIRRPFQPAEIPEMQGFIAAAVRRVDRHIHGTMDTSGPSITDQPEQVLAEQKLAVQVVLADYYRSQQRGGGTPTTAVSADETGVAGRSSLHHRLVDLLGPAARMRSDNADQAADARAPRGAGFPPPSHWPDPYERGCW